ncbi:MAG: MGMT family protein [Clostridia bacterium]|nr:MGMT family protein [Clostridia bacterium]
MSGKNVKKKFSEGSVFELLCTIPRGRVTTYGDLAEALGNRSWARAVGNALHKNSDGEKYPCYKVVNSRGGLSFAYAFGGAEAQKKKLEAEGVSVENYRVDLERYGFSFEKNSKNRRKNMVENAVYTPLEEAVSFYTRNDFAIYIALMLEKYDQLWQDAKIAYKDNLDIIGEFENGARTVESDEDIKWLNSLRKRVISEFDDETKLKIIETAKSDISLLLNAMKPAEDSIKLYRSAWVNKDITEDGAFAFSREYSSLKTEEDGDFDIGVITSCSLTPYRAEDDLGSERFGYIINVPKGFPILKLDDFSCHNEDGEVLLPPTRFKVLKRSGGEAAGEKEKLELCCEEVLDCEIWKKQPHTEV